MRRARWCTGSSGGSQRAVKGWRAERQRRLSPRRQRLRPDHMPYRWNFAPVFENLDVLAAGALGTLRLFTICVVLGMGFGLVVGLGRHATARWIYAPATAF